jgi:hypothetical protein
VDYRVVGGVVEARLRKLDHSATAAEREGFERNIVVVRWIFLAKADRRAFRLSVTWWA